MGRTIPAPVRAAHAALAAIRPATDPQEWEMLNRKLPGIAMRLAAQGADVTVESLRVLATGPRDIFNAAAQGHVRAAFRFADLPALFAPPAPTTDLYASVSEELEAALRAQDVSRITTALGGQSLRRVTHLNKVSAILEQMAADVGNTAIAPAFFNMMRIEGVPL